MKHNTLLRTNILVCVIIIIGFTLTSIISYRSNFGMHQKDIEMLSSLSSDGLYNEISGIFSQPVSVALTMANDTLLRDFLISEQANLSDDAWMNRMRGYLGAYRLKYDYDSVFLVSTATDNYYHYEGVDRVLTPDNPENEWYYSFLAGDEEYELNVDNDEAADDGITVFINCRIKDGKGSTLGVVGVGLRVDSLQSLFASYEQQYGVRICLINDEGTIEVSSSANPPLSLFDTVGYKENKDAILENHSTQECFWYSSGSNNGYVITRYEPNLQWHLVVENDTSAASRQLNLQLLRNIIIIAVIILFVLSIITYVILRYNAQILKLTISQELEYQHLLHEMTEGLYEDIFELDITHNRAGGESTRRFFESLGIGADATYDEALHLIAGSAVKGEYAQGYIDTFKRDAVVTAFQNGITNLSSDLMISKDGINYHWVRISARIFFWNSDQSLRMITYRMNIDAQKQREFLLLDGTQRDSMTGLYNKRTTEELVTAAISSDAAPSTQCHALLIFDIDNFKSVNDTMGHRFGDRVISEIVTEIKAQFHADDIIGRIGGDEFAVFVKDIEYLEELTKQLEQLHDRLGKKDFGTGDDLFISCSVGIARFPQDGTTYSALYERADQALYHAKSHGKNSFFICED